MTTNECSLNVHTRFVVSEINDVLARNDSGSFTTFELIYCDDWLAFAKCDDWEKSSRQSRDQMWQLKDCVCHKTEMKVYRSTSDGSAFHISMSHQSHERLDDSNALQPLQWQSTCTRGKGLMRYAETSENPVSFMVYLESLFCVT